MTAAARTVWFGRRVSLQACLEKTAWKVTAGRRARGAPVRAARGILLGNNASAVIGIKRKKEPLIEAAKVSGFQREKYAL